MSEEGGFSALNVGALAAMLASLQRGGLDGLPRLDLPFDLRRFAEALNTDELGLGLLRQLTLSVALQIPVEFWGSFHLPDLITPANPQEAAWALQLRTDGLQVPLLVLRVIFAAWVAISGLDLVGAAGFRLPTEVTAILVEQCLPFFPTIIERSAATARLLAHPALSGPGVLMPMSSAIGILVFAEPEVSVFSLPLLLGSPFSFFFLFLRTSLSRMSSDFGAAREGGGRLAAHTVFS